MNDIFKNKKFLHLKCDELITSEHPKISKEVYYYWKNDCTILFTTLFAYLNLDNLETKYIIDYLNVFLEIYTKNNLKSDTEILYLFQILVEYNKLDEFIYLNNYFKIYKFKDNIIDLSISNSLDIFNFLVKSYNLDIYYYLQQAFLKNLFINYDKFNPVHKKILVDFIDKLNNKTSYDLLEISNTIQSYKYNNKFIDDFILTINNLDFINSYILNAIEHIDLHCLKHLLELRSLNIRYLNYQDILNKLLLISSDYENKPNEIFVRIWCLLIKYIKKYLDENTIKLIINKYELNILVTIKNSKKIIKTIVNYINNINLEDINGFTPFMDCLRYGDLETCRYLMTRLDIDFSIVSEDYFDVLTCAFHNTNSKVLPLLINFLNKKKIIPILNDNIDLFMNTNKFQEKIIYILDYLKTIDYYKYKLIINSLLIYKNFNVDFLLTILDKYDFEIVHNICYINPNCINCSNINKDKYIEFYSRLINKIPNDILENIIFKLISIGCFCQIEKLLTKINININKLNLKIIEHFKLVDVYNCMNNCTLCKKNIEHNFTNYLTFVKKFFGNETNIIYYKWKYSFSVYVLPKHILYLLFKNQYYPYFPYLKTLNIKTYDTLIMLFINKKKEQHFLNESNDINMKYIYSWLISLYSLKRFIRRKNKEKIENLKHIFKPINFDIKFSPLNKINKINKRNFDSIPKHITPIDCLYPLNETHLYITQKADGIYKKGLFNVFPNIPETINKIHLEYESMKDIAFIFNYSDHNCYCLIEYLRNYHPFVPKLNIPPLNLENIHECMTNYINFEKAAIKNFKQENQYKNIKLWWPKMVFRLSIMDKGDYLKLLDIISSYNASIFDTDGWILIDNDYTNLLKIKPLEHLTIDLQYKQNSLVDQSNISYVFKSNFNLKERKIYRCYYDNGWNPREIRNDKKKPNETSVCKFIEKSHIHKWNIARLNVNIPYYHRYISNHKDKLCIDNDCLSHVDGTVLDLGCGFDYKKIMKKTNKYVGFDCDAKILVENRNCKNLYIVDLNQEWNSNLQQKSLGDLYNYVPNILDFNNKKYGHFNTILCLNSLHYFVDNIDILMKNINNYTMKNSLFLIRILDIDLLKTILDHETIIKSPSGISYIKYFENKIKIYYDWVHFKPLTEQLIDKNELETKLYTFGWKIENIYKNKINTNDDNWTNYFRCFSLLKFVKV